MKRFILTLLGISCYICPGLTQERVDIFGYFESTLMGTVVNNRDYFLNTNKLRVDLKSLVTENITFAANFDYITYHGTTTWQIPDFLPQSIISQIPDDMKIFYRLDFHDRQFLDNAYVKFAFRYFDLTAGKQQISLGTGYVWNPLDIFNIKDPLDPTYEQPGHNALRIDIPVGFDYGIALLYSVNDNWKNSAKLFRFKGRTGHFDYTLLAGETVWRYHEYEQFDTDQMSFTEFPELRRLLGASMAGEIFGIGTWAEFAHNYMRKSKDYHELVLGADYTFDFQTYIMFEFYQNTLGKSDYSQYELNDWMRLLTAEQKAISRNQIYAFITHPVTDLIDLGTSCIYSISDGSLVTIPTLTYSYSANVDIMSYLNFSFGREGTVYSKSTGNGGLIRARVYF